MINPFKSLKDRFRYDEREMPFLEHLEEFRKMIIRSFIALTLGVAVCLPFADQLLLLLRAPAEPYIEQTAAHVLGTSGIYLDIPRAALSEGTLAVDADGNEHYRVRADVVVPAERAERQGTIRLQFSEPSAAIKMWMSASFFGGVLLSLPFLVFIIGSFVLPGVRDVERKVLRRIAILSGGLFLLGVWLGYSVTLPMALKLMLRIGGALDGESIWFYSKYVAFTLHLLLGFGLAFQLPVVILLLGKMGLVSSRQLREKRRHVVVGLLILAMLLTPPDVATQLLMAAPLILLYEFCIWFLYFSGDRGGNQASEPISETVAEHDETKDQNKE